MLPSTPRKLIMTDMAMVMDTLTPTFPIMDMVTATEIWEELGVDSEMVELFKGFTNQVTNGYKPCLEFNYF